MVQSLHLLGKERKAACVLKLSQGSLALLHEHSVAKLAVLRSFDEFQILPALFQKLPGFVFLLFRVLSLRKHVLLVRHAGGTSLAAALDAAACLAEDHGVALECVRALVPALDHFCCCNLRALVGLR